MPSFGLPTRAIVGRQVRADVDAEELDACDCQRPQDEVRRNAEKAGSGKRERSYTVSDS